MSQRPRIPTFSSVVTSDGQQFYMVPMTRFWRLAGRIHWVCYAPGRWNQRRRVRKQWGEFKQHQGVRDPLAAVPPLRDELPLIERILCGIVVALLILGAVWVSTHLK